jgi:hypothetical protein
MREARFDVEDSNLDIKTLGGMVGARGLEYPWPTYGQLHFEKDNA